MSGLFLWLTKLGPALAGALPTPGPAASRPGAVPVATRHTQIVPVESIQSLAIYPRTRIDGEYTDERNEHCNVDAASQGADDPLSVQCLRC